MRSLIVLSLVTLLACPALAEKPSVKSMPPVVVKTVPQSGATAVDAKLKEIKVTFSKDMITKKMWSFVRISKDSYPAFRDVGNNPAVPYLLVFETK